MKIQLTKDADERTVLKIEHLFYRQVFPVDPQQLIRLQEVLEGFRKKKGRAVATLEVRDGKLTNLDFA